MAAPKGKIAALIIAKAKPAGADAAPSERVKAARSVLDAIKADDEVALDAALNDWDRMSDDDAGEGGGEAGESDGG